MDAESECIACNVKRIVIGVTPVARGYEMRSFECPQCSNLHRLVVRHRRPNSRVQLYRCRLIHPSITGRPPGSAGEAA